MERPRPLDPDTPHAAEAHVLRATTRRWRWIWPRPTDRPRPLDPDSPPHAAQAHVLRPTTRRGAEPARVVGSGGGSGAGRTLWDGARARCGTAAPQFTFLLSSFFIWDGVGLYHTTVPDAHTD